MNAKLSLALFAIALPLVAQEKKDPFPLRAKFPQLECISTDELRDLQDPIVVDARNKIEFDVVHVEGAVSLDVTDMKKADLEAVRAADGTRTIVFYCNGVTCKKSYEAAEKARIWGFTNCKVYDAGVFTWAENNPTRTRFFGDLLTKENVKTKLIPKSELQAISLSTADFIAKARSGDYKVYDIRDTKDRQDFPIKLPKIAKLPMDDFVTVLEKGAVPAEKVLILDNVGKQVNWLQYYLRRAGHKDHHFLLGGVGQWKKDGFDSDGNPIAAKPAK
ncbi:MAG: rhodanese-like domain-containing protein [Planctomycetes bacterium]|nr:rhodanese-like domain-containing protein [Planctomycetota bacterium]